MSAKQKWQTYSNGTKAAIIAGSVLLIGAAVAIPTTIALTNKPKEKTSLTMWVPWTETNFQSVALEEIVKEYNANNGNNLDVELSFIDGGYSGITDNFKTDLQLSSKQQDEKLPDLYIGYMDSTSTLLSANKGLDFSKTIDKSTLYAPMLRVNDEAVGSKKGELYSIPFSASSELMGIDSPLFITMLHDFLANGGTISIDGDTSVIKQLLDAADGTKDGYIAAGTADEEAVYTEFAKAGATEATVDSSTIADLINKAYNNVDAQDLARIRSTDVNDLTNWNPTSVDMTGRTINVSDYTFHDFERLIEMANTISELYGLTPASAQGEKGIVGTDAPDNTYFVLSSLYSQSYNDATKGIDYLNDNGTPDDRSDDYIDWALFDGEVNSANHTTPSTTSAGYNAAKQAYETLYTGMETGALWLPGNGGYGSDLMTAHKMAMSIGSTAGAAYLFNTKNEDYVNQGEVVYMQAPDTAGTTSQAEYDSTAKVHIQQGPGIGAVKKADEKGNNEAQNFVSWLLGSEEVTFNDGYSDYVMTPSEYMSYKSEYISATNSVITGNTDEASQSSFEKEISKNVLSSGYWDGDTWVSGKTSDGNYINKYFIGPKIAYQNFMSASSSDSYLYNEPTSKDTGNFRSVIKGQLLAEDTALVNGTTTHPDYKDFIAPVFDDAYTNGWISTNQLSSTKENVLINEKRF